MSEGRRKLGIMAVHGSLLAEGVVVTAEQAEVIVEIVHRWTEADSAARFNKTTVLAARLLARKALAAAYASIISFAGALFITTLDAASVASAILTIVGVICSLVAIKRANEEVREWSTLRVTWRNPPPPEPPHSGHPRVNPPSRPAPPDA